MNLTNPGLISCHDLRGKVLLTTHRDSVLLHFYLAPDMYPPPLAMRNKTRHVKPSPACLMYNARRNEDERNPSYANKI